MTRPTAASERAAIVRWLRSRDHVCADILAEEIEKGRHREGKAE